MASSRFQRGATSTTSSDTSASSHTPSVVDDTQFQELQQRLERIKERRMRYTIDLERAKKEVAECEAQAQKMGISSLEELEEYVKQAEEEDKKALEAFINSLNEEEDRLNTIERQLTNLDRHE